MKGIPTVYNSKYGFFFEPRPDNHLIKLCNEFPGYTNYQEWTPFGATTPQKISVPRSHADNPSDTIPTEVLEEIQRLVKMCLPQFADRPLINQSMCWCTDTDDAKWLLCEHPKWKGLVLATGDSGHTFKMLPVVGGQVADLIEGKVGHSYSKLGPQTNRINRRCQSRESLLGDGDLEWAILTAPEDLVLLPKISLKWTVGGMTRCTDGSWTMGDMWPRRVVKMEMKCIG